VFSLRRHVDKGTSRRISVYNPTPPVEFGAAG